MSAAVQTAPDPMHRLVDIERRISGTALPSTFPENMWSKTVKRILVVDDDPAMTRLTQLRLESTGAYEVFTENRGSHAVAAARECRPDLILLDIMMPDMPGNNVVAALREDPALRHIKVIFLTSMLKKGEEKRSGRDIVVAKPIDADELVAVIEHELGEGRSEPAVSHSLP